MMNQQGFRLFKTAFAGKTVATTSGRQMRILKLEVHKREEKPDYTGQLESGGNRFRLGARHGDHYLLTDMNGNPQPDLLVLYTSIHELTHEQG